MHKVSLLFCESSFVLILKKQHTEFVEELPIQSSMLFGSVTPHV